jgi:hypothetical protein
MSGLTPLAWRKLTLPSLFSNTKVLAADVAAGHYCIVAFSQTDFEIRFHPANETERVLLARTLDEAKKVAKAGFTKLGTAQTLDGAKANRSNHRAQPTEGPRTSSA